MPEWLASLLLVFKLGYLILVEYYEAKKRARIANEKYETDKKAMLEIAQRALDRMRTEALKESQQAQDVEDQVDAALNKKSGL